MKKTWDRAAMRIASARYLARQGMLEATFGNGDRFLVAAECLVPAAGPAAPTAPDWTGMRIGETGDVLEVPAQDGVLEIPWDRIRSLADPEFRAHLADRAAERARRLGARVRALRLAAGLTRGALAERAGVSGEVIADLEGGRMEPGGDLIQDVAAALGKRLRDFAEE